MQKKNGHILVVDDNRLNRLKLTRGVQNEGHTVDGTDKGNQALQLLRHNRYDLIFLDTVLPDMDGLQLLSTIRNDPLIPPIPVILLISNREIEKLESYLSLGASGYMLLPFDATTLKTQISQHLLLDEEEVEVGKILVVDDDHTSRLRLSRTLEQHGFKPTLATNGTDALALVTQETPDLILLDVMMPDIDGFEVCRRLKAHDRTADIPIMFLTALTNTEDKLKGFSMGAVDYITKPIHEEEALARVRTHLRIRALTHRLERSYTNEQKRRQLSDTLREVAKIVSITLKQEQVLDLILTQLERVIHFDRASITLLNKDQLILVAGRTPEGPIEDRHPLSVNQYPLNALTLKAKQPILIADTRHDSRWQSGSDSGNIRSFINAPLLVQERIIGLLGISRSDEIAYNEDDAQTVFAFALQVAIALENARLVEQTQRALKETEGLFNGAQAILGSTSLSEICENLITQLRYLVNADQVMIHLVDHSLKKVTLFLQSGTLTPPDDGLSYEELQAGLAGQVFSTSTPILSNSADDGQEPPATRQRRLDSHIGALIVLPLISREQVIGVATVMNKKRGVIFSLYDVDLLTALVVQAATAIDNIRLYTVAQQELTERRRAEEALQQANGELTRLNADKDKFFSIMAHDLRSPFMPVIGNAQLIEEMGEQFTVEEIKEMGGAIRRSSARVLDLLNNLLDWARIQMGRMEYDPTTVDVVELVTNNFELLTDNAESKGIELIHAIPHDTQIYADQLMVDTIIRNLIANALKFTDAGGTITVSATPQADMMHIAIADTGIGIGPEDMAKLFKIDQHHTTQGTANEAGTGLGLIMCRDLVEKNGGKIWVDSVLGEGTTFTFSMPLSPSEETVNP